MGKKFNLLNQWKLKAATSNQELGGSQFVGLPWQQTTAHV